MRPPAMAVMVELFMPKPAGSPEEMPMIRVAGPIAWSSCSSAATATSAEVKPAASSAASARRSPKGATLARPSTPARRGISSGPNRAGGALVVWLAANMPSNSSV